MALEKTTQIDKIEVVGDFNIVQYRTVTTITQDGVEISTSNHRTVVVPGDDYSALDSKVQSICTAMHDADTIAAYEAHVASQSIPADQEIPE